MSENSDIKLWEEIKSDDEQSFSELFHIYYDSLFQFAGRYLNDTQLAENVVQEVFISFWEKRKSIIITSNLKSYLYKSTKNHCINYIKQNKMRFFQNDYPHNRMEYVQSPETKYLNNELVESIHDAINLLPEKCRQIYLLKRYDGLKYNEISDILNISVNTVKTQMKRAIKFLIEKISPLLQIFYL